MGYLDRRVQVNAVAGLFQAVPEFYVFNRGPRESFIQPPHIEKDPPPNRAASAPEC
jgi:hypothetical protein